MTTQLVEKRLAPELMIQDLDAFMAKIEELASL
ncbi:yecM family protein, partial [Vibrio harveyi]